MKQELSFMDGRYKGRRRVNYKAYTTIQSIACWLLEEEIILFYHSNKLWYHINQNCCHGNKYILPKRLALTVTSQNNLDHQLNFHGNKMVTYTACAVTILSKCYHDNYHMYMPCNLLVQISDYFHLGRSYSHDFPCILCLYFTCIMYLKRMRFCQVQFQ